jgi:hypothetical protein
VKTTENDRTGTGGRATFDSQRRRKKGRRKVTSSEQGNGGGTWRGHDLKRQHDGNGIWQRKRRLRQGRIKSYFVGGQQLHQQDSRGVTRITTDRLNILR